jgi:hypothetical protein
MPSFQVRASVHFYFNQMPPNTFSPSKSTDTPRCSIPLGEVRWCLEQHGTLRRMSSTPPLPKSFILGQLKIKQLRGISDQSKHRVYRAVLLGRLK